MPSPPAAGDGSLQTKDGARDSYRSDLDVHFVRRRTKGSGPKVIIVLAAFDAEVGAVIGGQLVFFLTPICDPESALPALAIAILARILVFILVRGYRAILLEGSVPEFIPLAVLWDVAMLVFPAGHVWFSRLRKSFPDVI